MTLLSTVFFLISLRYSIAEDNCEFGHLELASDLLPADCYADDIKGYYAVENCLPRCNKFPGNVKGYCENAECVPGYVCQLQTNKRYQCVPDTTSCGIYWVSKASNDYYNTVFRPSCDKDASFSAKQCKGEPATGRCFCFDKQGNRIFGQDWWKQADDMTCGCSRRKADLLATDGGPFFSSLHCDSRGNYEPLQCDIISEQCWCVEAATGELTAPVIPMAALSMLPCYHSALKFGNQYLRRCESQVYAQEKILNTLKIHNTTAAYGAILCDGDGAYGPYKILNGQAYCNWRDNTNISPWQSDASGGLETLNCNCARDTVIFQNAGKTMTQACDTNGNYKFRQVIGNVSYCVDSDGYQKSRYPEEAQSDESCASLI